jgi:hypothetical protein
MNEIEKEAQRIVNIFYRIETGFQWCEAKKDALKCVDEILKALYEFHYDSNESYDYYLDLKKQIEKI